MLAKKAHLKRKKYQNILTYSKGQTITCKGQSIKYCFFLVEGCAFIKPSEQGISSIIHEFPVGSFLNFVQIKYSCEMLKTIQCKKKCKIAIVDPLRCQPIKEEKSQSQQHEQIGRFLSKYCKKQTVLKQITQYCEFGQGNKLKKVQAQPEYLYLFCCGVIDIVDSSNKCYKRLDANKVYPIIIQQYNKDLQFHFLQRSIYFKLKLSILKYFFSLTQFESFLESIKACTQFYSHLKSKGFLLIKQKAHSTQNLTTKHLFSLKPQRKTHQIGRPKLERSKIMSQLCEAQKKLSFSIKYRIQEGKKSQNKSVHQIRKTKFRQFAQINRKINNQPCQFHVKVCKDHQLKDPTLLTSFYRSLTKY